MRGCLPLAHQCVLTKPRGSPRAAGSAEQPCARCGHPTREGSGASGTLETDTDLEGALSTPDKKGDQTRLRFSWGGHTVPLQHSLPALCHGGPMGCGVQVLRRTHTGPPYRGHQTAGARTEGHAETRALRRVGNKPQEPALLGLGGALQREREMVTTRASTM